MVHARFQAGLSIVSLLLAHFVLGQASHDTTMQAPLHNSTNGTIVLGGGYFDDKETATLLKKVIDLAGGAETSLVIIPTADAQLEPVVRTGSPTSLIDYEKAAGLEFASLGVKHLKVLHTKIGPLRIRTNLQDRCAARLGYGYQEATQNYCSRFIRIQQSSGSSKAYSIAAA